MPIGATVRVKDNGTFMYLRNLPKRTKRIGLRQAWNLTQKGAKLLRVSAVNANIKPWRGLLLNPKKGIEARKLGKGRYGIFIPYYGIHLDKMSPHFVSLKRGRLITRWVNEKIGKKGGAIMVRPHPYITRGYMRMVAQANRTANRIANKIVRG